MKKKNAFIVAILTLIPLFQPLTMKMSVAFSTTAFILSAHTNANAASKKLNPNSSNFIFENGLEKFYEADYEGAIADFTEAIEMNPNYIDAYLYRGIAKFKTENYEEAIADFNNAINIKPDFAEAYYQRGIVKFKTENYEEVISDLEEVLILDENFPEKATIYYYLGSAKLNIENYQGCLDIRKAVDLSGKVDNEWLNSVEVNFCSN